MKIHASACWLCCAMDCLLGRVDPTADNAAAACGVCSRSFYPGALSARDEFVEIRCGFTAVAPQWGQIQEGVLPIVAAFVGEIEYELVSDS